MSKDRRTEEKERLWNEVLGKKRAYESTDASEQITLSIDSNEQSQNLNILKQPDQAMQELNAILRKQQKDLEDMHAALQKKDEPLDISAMSMDVLERDLKRDYGLTEVEQKPVEKKEFNSQKLFDDIYNVIISKVMGQKAFVTDLDDAESETAAAQAARREKQTKRNTVGYESRQPERQEYAEPAPQIQAEPQVETHKSRLTEEKTKKATTAFIIGGGAVILVAAIVVLGIVLGWFGGGAKPIEVPNFTGKTIEQAQQEAEALGLKVEKGEEFYSADQEAGLITTQEPTAGSEVSEGKTIIVNISKGKKDGVMPKVVGKDLEEGRAELEALGFGISLVREVTDSKPKNTIIRQSIDAGQSAPDGTMIEVEVSNGKGKEMVKMPNIIGKTPDEANALLANEGLAAAVPVFEETTEIAQNLVFWQQYPEGTELEKGTEVQYKVSKGEQPAGSGNGTDVIDGDEEDPATDEE